MERLSNVKENVISSTLFHNIATKIIKKTTITCKKKIT